MGTGEIKSATIILQKSDNSVLLCKRSQQVSFFPSFWVFPGGKIDKPLPDTWTGMEPEVIETIINEMYEEIGIIPGSLYTIIPENRQVPYYNHDYNPKVKKEFIKSMMYIGKKKTPPFRIKIYNVAYYYIKGELVDNINPIVDGSEIVECIWITPQEAIKRWENIEMRLPPPTLHLLRTMASYPEQLQIKTLVETDLQIGLQTRVEFAPGFELIPFESRTIPPFSHTNIVVIRSNNECMIVDPGASSKEEEHFKEVILSLESPPKIVLTHHHKDHWNGLKYIEEIYPKSEVYAHPKTLERITTSLNPHAIESGSISVGSIILEVLHAPGHTNSHIVLFDHKTRTLIAGDHVVGYGSAVLSVVDGDMQDYFATTHKLLELKPRLVLPAHGPPNFNAIKLLKNYINHRQEREDAILNAINKGLHTLDDIVKEVYQDVPKQMWEFAKSNIVLHIRKLKNESKISDSLKF